MADRTYRCLDCPPGAPEHSAGPRGPLPERCPAHRADRERRRGRRRRSGLTVVPDDAPAPPAAPSSPAAPDIAPAPPRLADVVRGDLDALLSTHPARDTLVALAERLAAAADSPVVVLDPRALATLARELRATVRDLVDHEEAGDDDPFGADEDLPTAMVDAAARGAADLGDSAG